MTHQEHVQMDAVRLRRDERVCRMTARDIVELNGRMHVWRCPGCTHELPFKADQAQAIPFFIVRHLLRIHDIEPERIVAAEPALTAEVRGCGLRRGRLAVLAHARTAALLDVAG